MLVRTLKNTFKIIIFLALVSIIWDIPANIKPAGKFDDPGYLLPPDSIPEGDTTLILRYPFPDNSDLLFAPADTHGLYLGNPSNMESEIEYDPETNEYIFKNKIGDLDYRNPTYMSFDEYREWELNNSLNAYWKEQSTARSGRDRGDGIIPKIYIGSKVFETIFGSNTIDIRPQGSAELIFGVLANKTDNPTLNVRQRRTVNFDFQEKIQMNVVAKIGDKIEFRTNYNTEATFDFENKLNLKYEGKEDEIIQLIEAGDVSMPLNTTLINGSQSLFGIKTKLQFGKTTVTGLFSQQESQTSTVTVQGGAQTDEFSLTAVEYDENKHFFLSQYFRDNYENALKDLPIINSDINILRVEVWVTNIGAAVTENRNIVGFQDLGEHQKIYNTNVVQPTPGGRLPSNNSNNLVSQLDTSRVRDINTVTNYLKGNFAFVPGIDFEKVEVARKLDPSEYTLNSKLGFISLNTNINPDQTLMVSYQYTVIGYDSVFQVGEFSDQGISAPSCLITKLLKSTSLNTRVPMWDLMMKNVYSLGAYQVSQDKFMLNIFYSGNEEGVPIGYLTEGPEGIKGVPLIQVLNLDNLNSFMNPPPDGVFDFIDGAASNGGTIQSSNGKVYFTVLEPFAGYLRKQILQAGGDTALANKYAYDSLYTRTKVGAEQYPDKNKFLIQGTYQSSSGNEISLNAFNVPKGSVKVTAGGRVLTENVDYTVDYTLGRVRIINEGILNSGTPINISLENNTMFSLQTKRLMGAHVDHELNKDFHLGATIMNLTERPLTQKVSFGNDPISNTIWGLDFSYQTESRFLTKMVDKIPLIDTKAPSNITLDGEFAHFIPGHSKVIGQDGTTYIDDFEGAKSTIDLKNFGTWFLSSVPQGQMDLFPETEITLDIQRQINSGKNRARLAWYIIDPLFYDRNSNLVPDNISKQELSKNSVRQVLETEVFPDKDVPTGTPTNIPVFNLAFYPSEKGPYNYDVTSSGISNGINEDGSLKNPESRWGGIMRKIESTDFEATNVEYIEFWVMDPFTEDSANSGKLYFNLGDISEDILRDSRKSFENGLPTSATVENVDTTGWGRVPNIQALVESFDNEPDARPYQDVGYDGLGDEDERSFFSRDDGLHPYLDSIAAIFGANSQAYQQAFGDPSSDNYHYFRGTDYDNDPQYSSILERYKRFNGPDGNSPTDAQNPETYPTAATTLPNVEDINGDNTLSESERYFQYEIDLDRDKMNVGDNYITDIRESSVQLANGDFTTTKWYQFKIPVSQPDKVVGDIQDFRSIRFLRMFMQGFEDPMVLRFATLELVRGEWRKYRYDLFEDGDYIPNDLQTLTTFDISTVNVEENGIQREPVPYVIPPGIEREINLGTTNLIRLNEQSMVLKVCNLVDGDARAGYKTTDLDLRQYKRLKMFIHAEKVWADQELEYGDLTVFVRLGSDFTQNYYEYEIPLTFTPWGTSAGNPDAIWPLGNRMDIDLEELVNVKHRRNIAMRDATSPVSTNMPYIEYQGPNKVTVVGVPSISDVKTIMIGVRNPKKPTEVENEGKCAEIWVNELRLTDFNTDNGWAATASMSADLADLGRVVVSGSHSTPGFGSLEQKINETQKESITQIDVSTDLQLGKFFPEESGVRIPMHFDYSQTTVNPEYNPLDPDIKLKEDLDTYDSKEEQDSLKRLTQDFTERKSINFINVRKDRVGGSGKPKIWDIENFNVTYAYTVLHHRNVDVEYETQKQHRGGLGYNFNTSPQIVRPFEKVGFISKSSALKILKDFNFYYLPKSFSFNTEMNREYNEMKLRNKSAGVIKIIPTYVKRWDWNRSYNLRFDLSKGLSIDFNAQADAYINEPPGSIDKSSEYYDHAAADTISVKEEILSLGTMNRYNQSFNVNYKVPVDKLPLMDWTSATANYQANYSWTASPLSIQERLGNQIENSNTIQLNGNLSFDRLYNKSAYLKKINQKGGSRSQRGVSDRRNQAISSAQQIEEENGDTTAQQGKNYFKIIGESVLRVLMGLKKATITYSESNGTLLPGFTPEPQFMGNNIGGTAAPGFGFVFGSQDDIRSRAIENEWITRDSSLNQAFMKKHSEVLTFRATFEPINDLKIEFTADRNYAQRNQEYFRADRDGNFNSFSPSESGSFSISYITIGTAFEKNRENNTSEAFDNMKAYRLEIANRLARQNPNNEGLPPVYDSLTGAYYPAGYGPTNQEVLLHSFLAAYSGKGPEKLNTEKFIKIPLPNWRLTYSGLSKIAFIKKWFQKINITHSYRSSYSINSFTSDINYIEKNGHPSRLYDNSNVYISEYEMGQISIAEQFAPLFGLDMTWENNLLSKFEYKKSRNLALSLANNQVTEVKSNELIIGLGYRFKDLAFNFRSIGGGGSKRRISSDLNIKLDFSIRSNKTILRRIDEVVNQVSSGQQILSINASVDYALSQKLNIRLFFDKIVNNPYVSNQYRTSTTNGGLSLRFSLAQ